MRITLETCPGRNLEDLYCQMLKTLKICESPPTTRNWNVNGLLNKSRLCRHFHLLLRQLRFAKDLRRDVIEDDLGHVGNLLGNHRRKRVDETEDVHQLFHQQRHRIIEDLYHGSKAGKMLHGVPLDPLRGPGGSAKLAGRLLPGSSSYELESSGWAGGSSKTSPCASTRTSSPALAFFWRCALWCVNVARAAATDCCSCRDHERSRHCLRR